MRDRKKSEREYENKYGVKKGINEEVSITKYSV